MARPLLTLAALAVLAACGPPRPEVDQAPPGPGAAVRLPATVTPQAYRIRVEPDAARLSFRGAVSIDVQAHKPTRTIVLNAADLALDKVTLDGKPAKAVQLDATAQTARLAFDQALKPGAHTLSISYRGRINQGAQGLFALDYDTPQGRRRMLATQFEAVDARRFVPCWDEPARKASFDLTVVAPADQAAFSNMPVASARDLAGGLKEIRFQPTPKMSSYLLFLGLGDLERVSRTVDGVDVGVVVRRGAGPQAAYALDRAAELLAYYDRYFGVRYPLPKLDLIGAPGAAGFGAMENWGAILFFESRLLVDPRRTSQSEREATASTIAHEMAHQWFGDLVTMSWWEDVWLNESFANWMEAKALDDLHPDWRIWLTETAGREAAMRLDATSGTHPVVEPAETLEQVNEIPDSIVYDKGAAVVRMLEAYVGPDVWREGVRSYIQRFAYGNAGRADLWAAIEGAAHRPVAGIARDFTEQDGLPLVTVQVMTGQEPGSGVLLTQDRLGADAGSKGERHWRIPTAARPAGGGALVQSVVRSGPLVTALRSPDPGPLVINPGQVGYYRTLYAPSAFDPVLARLAQLQPADQLGLVDDGWALAESGYGPVENFMRLVDRLPASANPRVWAEATSTLALIDTLYQGQPGQAAYRAWARGRLRPLLARAGWPAKPGADDATAVLREELLTTLGRLDDPQVAAEARSRFSGFLRDRAGLAPEVRQAMLRIVGGHADATSFEDLRRMAAASSDPYEKRQFLTALAGVEDPALAARALNLSLSDETPATLAPVMIRQVAALHPDLAWDFALANRRALETRLDPSQRLNYFGQLLRDTADAAHADRLHAFAQTAYPAGGRREADKAEARIRQRAEVRRLRLPEIDRWLESRAAKGPRG
jgi:aminopeptidase N